MDWRIIELVKYVRLENATVYSSIKSDTLYLEHSGVKIKTIDQRSQVLDSDVYLTNDIKNNSSTLNNFNHVIFIPCGLRKRIRSKQIKGFTSFKYSLAYTTSDVRYILPFETSLNAIFKMTPRGVLLSRVRKHLMLFLEILGLKSLLPSAYVYSKVQKHSLVSKISESLNFQAVNSCLFTGTPGLTRRLTLQLQDVQNNFYYCKISTNEYSKKKITTELSVLGKVNLIRFSKTSHPKVLSKGFTESNLWFVQSSFKSSGYKHPKAFGFLHLSFLNDMATHSDNAVTLGHHKVFQNIISHSDLIKHANSDIIISKLQAHKHLKFKLTHSHGDFTSWNLKHNNKELFVYDWEAYTENQLPLFDLFHYHVQDGILVKKQSAKEIYNEIVSTLDKFKELIFFSASALEIDLLLMLYIIETRIEYAKLLNEEVPEFVQVQWQNKIRSEFITFLEKKLPKTP